MATQAASKVEHYIRVTRDVPTFAGKMFAGDILIVSTVNAKRPGSPVNAVCMLPPDAFEFVIPPAESVGAAAVETEEFDPLAELSI